MSSVGANKEEASGRRRKSSASGQSASEGAEQTTIGLPGPEAEAAPAVARKVRGSRKKPASAGRKSPPASEDAGEEFERRVGRVEFADGAFARLRVSVRAAGGEPGRDVLTDIDVLSLDVDLRLRLSRSISECKSGGGQAREPDRLLWLAGFRQFLGVERAVLVREAITARGAALARELDIELMDARTLAERESANAWLPDRFAHVGGQECSAAERRADTQIKGLGTIPPGLVAFLRHGVLLAGSYEALRAVAALGDAVHGSSVLPEIAGLVLAGHSLVAVICASVQDASQVGTISDDVLKSRLSLALTTGHPDDTYVLDVLARADDLIRAEFERLHGAYVDAGSQRLNLEPESLRALVAEQPVWIDRYVDFVHRLRSSPAAARDLLQSAELAVFDGLVGGKGFTADAFAHLFTREHRSLLFAGVRMLEDIAGKGVADRLADLRDLDWDRTPPAVPDRRQSAVEQEPLAELASETSRAQPR